MDGRREDDFSEYSADHYGKRSRRSGYDDVEYVDSEGSVVQIEERISYGSEGVIFKVGDNGVMKVYHPSVLDRNEKLESKIKYMCAHRPMRSLEEKTGWPVSPVYVNGKFRGFLMKELSGYNQLASLFDFKLNKPHHSSILLSVSLNLCIMLSSIHKSGYVVGDLSSHNVGYKSLGMVDEGHVCLYDVDSFAIRDEAEDYGCGVVTPGYDDPRLLPLSECTSPESLNIDNRWGSNSSIGYSEDSDNYALAVIIFKLFFNASEV